MRRNLLELRRGHREFEIRGRLIRDTTFDEDACQVRKKKGPVKRALCNDFTISASFLIVKDRSTRKQRQLSGTSSTNSRSANHEPSGPTCTSSDLPGDLPVSPTPARIRLSTPRRRHAAANQPPERRLCIESGPARPKRQHVPPQNRRDSTCSGTPRQEPRPLASESPENTGPYRISQLPSLRDGTTLSSRSCERTGFAVQDCPQHNLLRLLGRGVPKRRMREWHSHSM